MRSPQQTNYAEKYIAHFAATQILANSENAKQSMHFYQR